MHEKHMQQHRETIQACIATASAFTEPEQRIQKLDDSLVCASVCVCLVCLLSVSA